VFPKRAAQAARMFIQRLSAVLLASTLIAVSADEAGWKPLFNGKNLDGWVQKGGKAKYKIENNEIVGMAQPSTPNTFLCTTRDFTNFILEVEFKVAEGLNSGVQIRSQDTASEVEWNGKTFKAPNGRVHGVQVEIDTTKRAWSGGLYEEGRRGWLQDLTKNDAARAAFKHDDWNKYHIEAKGDHITTTINGIPAGDLHDPISKSGFIGLQVHGVGNKTNDLQIRFRNIRIKELP
jgi:hypothetical protein